MKFVFQLVWAVLQGRGGDSRWSARDENEDLVMQVPDAREPIESVHLPDHRGIVWRRWPQN